jgi:hypothetical protein
VDVVSRTFEASQKSQEFWAYSAQARSVGRMRQDRRMGSAMSTGDEI